LTYSLFGIFDFGLFFKVKVEVKVEVKVKVE